MESVLVLQPIQNYQNPTPPELRRSNGSRSLSESSLRALPCTLTTRASTAELQSSLYNWQSQYGYQCAIAETLKAHRREYEQLAQQTVKIKSANEGAEAYAEVMERILTQKNVILEQRLKAMKEQLERISADHMYETRCFPSNGKSVVHDVDEKEDEVLSLKKQLIAKDQLTKELEQQKFKLSQEITAKNKEIAKLKERLNGKTSTEEKLVGRLKLLLERWIRSPRIIDSDSIHISDLIGKVEILQNEMQNEISRLEENNLSLRQEIHFVRLQEKDDAIVRLRHNLSAQVFPCTFYRIIEIEF